MSTLQGSTEYVYCESLYYLKINSHWNMGEQASKTYIGRSMICICICIVFVLYLHLYFNCGCIGPVNPPLGVHDRPRRMIHYDRRWLLMADCLIANDVVHTVWLIVSSSMSVIFIDVVHIDCQCFHLYHYWRAFFNNPRSPTLDEFLSLGIPCIRQGTPLHYKAF